MSGWMLEEASETVLTDQLAGHAPYSGFMQSSFWAEFKRSEGYEVTRLIYEAEGERVGSASLLRFPLAAEAGFVLCPEGPVLPWDDTLLVRSALRELIQVTREMPNTLGLRIEPHLPTPLPSVLRNWADAPTDLTPADTLILDLSMTEQAMLVQAHAKCRYNLRVADRYGIEVISCSELSFVHEFYQLLVETSNRNGFFVEPFGFFLNLFSTLFSIASASFFWLNTMAGCLPRSSFFTSVAGRPTYMERPALRIEI